MTGHCGEGFIKIVGTLRLDCLDLDIQSLGRWLDFFQALRMFRHGRMPKDSDTGEFADSFFEQLKASAGQLWRNSG
jgi:hypothetical protein